MVLKGILKAECLKAGMSKLKGGSVGDVLGQRSLVVVGQRNPVVVGWVEKVGGVQVLVRTKVTSGSVAESLVRNGALFLSHMKGVETAIDGSGARIFRLNDKCSPLIMSCFST